MDGRIFLADAHHVARRHLARRLGRLPVRHGRRRAPTGAPP
ncbi:Uncharacterised protein [Bordetella pertussis]|nr:Uncharacterised protein [Bordetella pertussis]